jgi:hypothetical protein
MADQTLAQLLADRLLEGELEARITTRRGAGVSYDTIARELSTELGLEGATLSGETVRRWYRARLDA